MNPRVPQVAADELAKMPQAAVTLEELATTTVLDGMMLADNGFTASGTTHFKKVVTEYVAELLNRTVAYAEADRAAGLGREATHEHVRRAARHISASARKPNPWMVTAQVGEYLLAVVAGAGAGHLDKPMGILVFGLALVFGVVVLFYRTRSQ